MKILITGFEPFGGEKMNPAWEAVKRIEDIEGVNLIKYQLPTVFKRSSKLLFKKIKEELPDIVLCIGQAGGRYDISIERIGINIDDARIKDNDGNQPIDIKIFEDGKNAYFSTIPIKIIVDELKKNKIPASISNTAGTFVCNHILYSLLYFLEKNYKNIRGGFIHVPYLPEQVLEKKNIPFMDLDKITKALEIIIKTVKNNKVDKKITGGVEF